jgi:hypothetical protein
MDQPAASTLHGMAPEMLADGSAAHGKIEMVFRFWGANSHGAETGGNGATHAPINASGSSPGHHPGVLALIEDAVASKRGVFVSSREYLYISRLRRPSDALVVSRQVQLGLEGFRARPGSGPVAVSIAINASRGEQAGGTEAKEPAGQEPSHDPPHDPPHDLVTLLKLAKPAQILLTHDLCQQMAAIKGLPLRSFPARFGVYEYLWTAEEKLDLLQSEPQLTLAALPMAQPAKEKTAAIPAGMVAGTTKAFEAPATPAGIAEERSGTQRGVPRAYVYGGAGLAAVVALAVIGIHFAQKPAQNPAPISAPVESAAPAMATPVPSAAVPAAAVPARQPLPKPHASAKPPAAKPVASAPAQEAATPAAPSADCTLGADVSRYVGLGEQARGRGDYANAARIFREVLACDPNNAAAREGLAKAMQAQQQPE